jgi:hypothetical protein
MSRDMGLFSSAKTKVKTEGLILRRRFWCAISNPAVCDGAGKR